MSATRLAFRRKRTRFLLTVQEARRFCGFLRQLQDQKSWSIRRIAMAAKGAVSRARLQDWLNAPAPKVRRSSAEAIAKIFGEELTEIITQQNRDRARLAGLDDVLTRAAAYNLPSPELMFRALHEVFLYLREWGTSVVFTAHHRSDGDDAFLRVPLGSSTCHAQIILAAESHGFCYEVCVVKGAAKTATLDGVLTLDSARRLRLHLRELDRREMKSENLRFQVDRKNTAFSNTAHRP